MSEPETVYDSTEMQLKTLNQVVKESLRLEELATPPIVQIILERELVLLTELKTLKNKINEVQDANLNLISERENLRIGLAKSEQRESISWIEIPIGILSGFAINMLSNNLETKLK